MCGFGRCCLGGFGTNEVPQVENDPLRGPADHHCGRFVESRDVAVEALGEIGTGDGIDARDGSQMSQIPRGISRITAQSFESAPPAIRKVEKRWIGIAEVESPRKVSCPEEAVPLRK